MSTADQMPFLSTRRGKLTLALLCSIAFVDFVDASIVNLALPSIRHDLHFSTRSLVWVPSAYLLTYGGLMLLGGRAADLLGRRRVLIAGTVLIGVASLVGGLAQSSSVLVGARLAQGVGAAAMLPTALSILTTLFREGSERNLALGAWGGVGGISSAIGVLAGGALTEGPGWRWVFFVNPFACLLVVAASFALLDGKRPETRLEGFDLAGAILSTAGALLAIYALVNAPTVGWGNARTIGEIAGAVVLFAGFAINELRQRNPLVPPPLFRIKGIAVANITQLFAFCGFLSIFFFLTLYMRGMLGYSPIKVGVAYLPLCVGAFLAAGAAGPLLSRAGARPMIVTGGLTAAGGIYWLSRIPVHGSYLSDVLPGTLLLAVGMGPVWVGVASAATSGVAAGEAGLAASLLNASQQLGGALGLAVLSALASSRTGDLLARHTPASAALVSGFQRALLGGSIFLASAAVIALRASNTHGETAAQPDSEPGLLHEQVPPPLPSHATAGGEN